jgi:hypothetical protein
MAGMLKALVMSLTQACWLELVPLCGGFTSSGPLLPKDPMLTPLGTARPARGPSKRVFLLRLHPHMQWIT